jgi:hypothetical protein
MGLLRAVQLSKISTRRSARESCRRQRSSRSRQATDLTCPVKTSKKDAFYSERVADDKEPPQRTKGDRPSAPIIPLFRGHLLPVPVTPLQASTHFPFDYSDESSRVEFDLLDQDLRGLKDRYLAALEKTAEAADRPELAQDIRIIAKRVEASFTSLILLSDLLAGLPHDNDDVPA